LVVYNFEKFNSAEWIASDERPNSIPCGKGQLNDRHSIPPFVFRRFRWANREMAEKFEKLPTPETQLTLAAHPDGHCDPGLYEISRAANISPK
jgi:hypothetical protein